MSGSAVIGRELAKIDDELKVLDQQLAELRRRKRTLTERKDQLNRILAAKQNNTADNTSWESETFPWSAKLRECLKTVFKLDNFRPLQMSVINACLSGEDTLLIMSTGGGKSLCYQLPAVVSNGITLVVSPLISLMEDQVMALEQLNVPAVALSQATPPAVMTETQNAMIGKGQKNLSLVYVTPERLAKSKRFMSKLEKCYEAGRLKLIAIDECHCCSQWGNDFRPDYKFLNVMRRQFPNTPILGLTATASETVLDDVKNILNIPAALVFRATFNRENLFYEVRHKSSDSGTVLEDLRQDILGRFARQSGIIYCFSRKEASELTTSLRGLGIKAGCYHADMPAAERSDVHKKWVSNHYQVIVATVAFGMGIDKPDVRFVIHHSLAKSIENYYQESGRAGRDGEPAVCLLYYKFADVFRQSTMVCTEKTGVQNLHGMVAYCQTTNAECRRAVVARHFGESWEQSWCRSMCDNCKQQEDGFCEELVDIGDSFRAILKILQSSESKLTALKLVESLQKHYREKDKKSQPTRFSLERSIVYLLLEGYLKEDFHFTPYNIISYLVLGTRGIGFGDEDTIIMPTSTSETPSADKRPKKKQKTSNTD